MVKKRHSKRNKKSKLAHQCSDHSSGVYSFDATESQFQDLGFQTTGSRISSCPRSFMDLEEISDEGLYFSSRYQNQRFS